MGNGCVKPYFDNKSQVMPLLRAKQYNILSFLGLGAYGVVLKCHDSDTNTVVAIKLPIRTKSLEKEAKMMHFLMEHRLDEQNIVKFHHGFWMNSVLVFEYCDISLKDYIEQQETPMLLQDIRAVIQQLAVAFDALKKVGVIHTDLRTDNIMLVEPTSRPLQVKLIDFGLAIFTNQAKCINIDQFIWYKAPELILGLSYSEAVDIWSLGCVMAKMIFNCDLFPGSTEYESLCYMIDLLGPPPDHIISAGGNSDWYFNRTDSNQWMLKTPEEYWGENETQVDERTYKFCCLDETKRIKLDNDSPAEEDETSSCMELLKAMLKWDEEDRICPSQILTHPFITMNQSNTSIRDESVGSAFIPTATVKDEDSPNKKPKERNFLKWLICCQMST